MEINLKHYGVDKYFSSNIIELKVSYNGNTLVSSVTNLDGMVDEDLIFNLRDIANDLEIQNRRVTERIRKC